MSTTINNFRIVSLVPSLTELLVSLGLEKSIIGVTKFCVHPSYIKKQVEVIGGTKNPKLDKILLLNPTHIITNKEENNKEDVDFLSNHSFVHVSDIKTIEDVFVVLKEYASLFKVYHQAMHIDELLRRKLAQFQTELLYEKEISVAYLIWKEPWMTIGSDTFIHEMLTISKFKNVFEKQTRYPEINLKDLQQADVVFLSSEPYPFKQKHIDLIKNYNQQAFLVDGELFSWYGSRLLHAFDYFIQLRSQVKLSLSQ